jgi:hypothetical protein
LGDSKGFKEPTPILAAYLLKLLERLENPSAHISIVTAIHFGKHVIEKTEPEKISGLTSREAGKVDKILRLLNGAGLKARAYSHQQIDKDFCYLANARYLVLANGYFSLCAAMVSQAQCFIPPWVYQGDCAPLMDTDRVTILD